MNAPRDAVTSPVDPQFLGGLVLVAAVPIAIWWTWRRAPAVVLALGMLALTYAMVSNLLFLIGTIMAERLLYLPLARFIAAIVIGMPPLRPPVATAVFGIIVVAFATRTACRRVGASAH